MSQKHSPEPWKTDFWMDGPFQILDAENEPVVGHVTEFNGTSSPIFSKIENLERIVACVNALNGIPTESLQKVANGTARIGCTPDGEHVVVKYPEFFEPDILP